MAVEPPQVLKWKTGSVFLQNMVSKLIFVLAVGYAGLTGFFFYENPTLWLTRDWRLSIFFLPYAPVVHDLFLWAIFTIIFYRKLKTNLWLGMFFVWAFAETFGALTDPWIWPLYYSYDFTFYFKLVFYLFAFAVAVLALWENKEIQFNFSKRVITAIILNYALVDINALLGINISIDFIGAIAFLSIAYYMIKPKVNAGLKDHYD